MNKNVLAVVTTPSQLLNVIEYIHTELGNKCKCILFITAKRKETLSQANNLISLYKFEKIIYIKPAWNKISELLTIKKQYKKIIGEFDPHTLIIGNYLDKLHRISLNCVDSKLEVILLDDGNGVLMANQIRNKEIESKQYSFGKLTNRLICYSLNLNKPFLRSLTYYSSYKLKVDKKDRLIKNSYTYFQSLLQNSEGFIDKYIILGVPAIEREVLEKNEYLKYIKELKKLHPEAIYYPHRYEDYGNIDEISKILPVENHSEPIEIYMLNNNRIYKNIVSFYTSAFVPLHKIYGKNINLISFVIKTESPKIKAKYQYLKDELSDSIKFIS